MIEVMVGLIALLVLVAGLLQVASLTKAQTDSMVEAREDAGRRAFSENQAFSETADYIQDIEVGPDGRTYSLDDTTTPANGGRFRRDIISHTVSAENQWEILEELPDQSFTTLNNAGNPISTFGLLKGSASRTITLRPAVRSLIYRAEEIEIESDVWMTWTKGIY